jgi:hypothetical protein
MKKKELLKKIKDLPEDAMIWLGADIGEGWIPLEEVFSCNALDAPLDGDEVSEEIEYMKRGAPLEDSWEVDDDDPKDKEVRVGKPIIILGGRETESEVESHRQHRLRDVVAERLQSIAKRKKDLELQLEKLKQEEEEQNDKKRNTKTGID